MPDPRNLDFFKHFLLLSIKGNALITYDIKCLNIMFDKLLLQILIIHYYFPLQTRNDVILV